MGNKDLIKAAKNKNDEFYTDLTDIEKEMRYYTKYFKDKIVLCNCDDPFESNFFKYFVLNFNRLGLKKLIATCYATSPIANKQISLLDVGCGEASKGRPYKAVVTKVYDTTGDGSIDMLDVAELFKMGENKLTELAGDGDFKSDECLKLLEEADVVVTNPPFSEFRSFVDTLMKYKKDFLIIGSVNAITYKEFFPLLKENKVWMGASIHSGDRRFFVPDDYPLDAAGCGVDENGRRFIRVKGVRWWTNIDYKQRHEDLILIKKYSPEDYPKYDNYDAINVDVTKSIPYNYEGMMGVPITFIDKYNPDQFEIIGLGCGWNGGSELIIREYSKDQLQVEKNTSKPVSKLNDGTPVIKLSEKPNKTYYLVDGEGFYYRTYGRILIRNKRPEIKEEN